MTTFKGAPVQIGDNTGAPSTDTRGFVPVYKEVSISASGKIQTRALPPGDNSLVRAVVLVDVAVTGSATFAAGINIRLGDSTNVNKFGSVAVSAVGSYTVTLSAACISAGTELIIDATAQSTAADLFGFNSRVYVEYISKG